LETADGGVVDRIREERTADAAAFTVWFDGEKAQQRLGRVGTA